MKITVHFSAEVEVDPPLEQRAHEFLHARLASFLSKGIPWMAMGMAGIDAIHLTDFRKVDDSAVSAGLSA